MNQIIESYVRKVLEIGCNIRENDSVIVYSNDDISDFEETLLRIKDEYKIKEVILIRRNYEKIYKFLKKDPSYDGIKKFITKYPKLQKNDNVKIISAFYVDHSGYFSKICNEVYDLYRKYCKFDGEINSELYENFSTGYVIGVSCPTKYWAKSIQEIRNIKKLWNLINKTVPDVSNFKEEILRLTQIKEYLNKEAISELYFYTNLGTDFRIGLSEYSKWTSEPTIKNGIEYFSNFPSYEIFTAPDCNTAEGRVVVNKPSYLYGDRIENAILQFSEGKCISCQSDNERWNSIVLDSINNLYRIGEIALVSNDTPLAKMNRTFNSILLDENTGCHLALGYAYPKCIDIPENILLQNGLNYYNFNSSEYHQDLVFGNDSITVEAKTRDKRKILLMENGLWKI